MFTVTIYLEQQEYPLYDLRNDELFISQPTLVQELNKSGQFTFSVLNTHPYGHKIKKMESEIRIYEKGQLIYNGRPIYSETDFMETIKYICEGELGYLLDSVYHPFEFQGQITTFFHHLLQNHNAQVEEKQKFEVGEMTIADSNRILNCSSEYHMNTLEVLQSQLVDPYGGYLRVRHQNGRRYLDYISDYGRVNEQMIEFAENLLDISKFIDTNEFITAVIPLGAEIEVSEGVWQRVTIAAVNNGQEYLVDEEAKGKYGWICRTVEFDDITLPSELMKRGQKYLNTSKSLSLTIELTALDLSLLNMNLDNIRIGDFIRVISKPHAIDDLFLISKVAKDLSDPTNNTVVLGKTLTTFTADVTTTQKEFNQTARQVREEQSTVSTLLDTMQSIRNELQTLKRELQGVERPTILFQGSLRAGQNINWESSALAYKKLRIYLRFEEQEQIYTLDFSQTESKTAMVTSMGVDSDHLVMGQLLANRTQFHFPFLHKRSLSTGEVHDLDNHSLYYVYKIEGVKEVL